MKKVTIKDVAKYAGVSPSTVSRVVSNKGTISEETRKRILDAIDELGYVPNYSARSLVNSSSDTIAVVVSRTPRSLDNAYFTDVLQAIAGEIDKFDKEILLIFASSSQEEKEKIKRLYETHRIDGVIKLSVMEDDMALKYIAENKVPCVVIGNPDRKNKILWVDNDNQMAMEEVMESVISDGHEKLAFVGGSPNLMVTKDRLSGFKKSMISNKLTFTNEDIYYVDFTEEDAYRNADKIINKAYDYVICTDDMIAIGIKKRAIERNIDVKVTGFNNTKEASLYFADISTVDIKTQKLGKWAVRLLVGKLNGDATITNKIVKTEFIKK